MEVCVDSIESVLSACNSGASRLELCAGLSEGGLTPSLGLFRQVRELVDDIPVNVLIRPRSGDFCYSRNELKVMQHDIRVFREAGASGIVLGVLTNEGQVDKNGCTDLLAVCRPLPVTFHRAFDWTPDPESALDDLIELGFTRLLTSGQQRNALLGSKLLSSLVTRSQGKVIVMPGGGINEDNLVEILESTGAKEFHASASRMAESQMKHRSHVPMGSSGDDFTWKECSASRVKNMVSLADTVFKGRLVA